LSDLGWVLIIAAAMIFAWIWASTRIPSRRIIRNNLRRAIRRSEKGKIVPRTNGQGSKYGNRRIFRGKTRKPRPAPPNLNGGKRRPE